MVITVVLKILFFLLTRMNICVILMIVERSARGQSDINLGHKGQAVADTKINRLRSLQSLQAFFVSRINVYLYFSKRLFY